MSRHRYVRNLDLDAELDDHDEEYFEGEDGEEPDDGMTPEERAQMASALPVARAQLKGLKPPISDAEIQDSLWHYWFDVDKAVSWLKKDWEKKGDPGPPEHLVPTPDQVPRPRRKTRKPKPVATEPKTQPAEATLTALQRLSLARKAASSAPSAAPSAPASVPTSAQGSLQSSAVPSPTASPAPSDSAKPLSKLALLRQKRMESAKAAAPESVPASTSLSPVDPASSSSPAALPESSPESSVSNASHGVAIPNSPAKPLSKLAQKMAAARAAREAAAPTSLPVTPHETPSSDPVPEPIDEMWAFTAPTPAPASVFFSILTTHTPESALPEPPSLADMHIAVRDREAAGRKVRDAFGPGVESPDDIVLRKRDGRAGTAAITGASSTSEKPHAHAVRAMAAETPLPPSEVKEQPKPKDKEPEKPNDKEPAKSKSQSQSKSKDVARGGRQQRGRAQSPTKPSNAGNGRRPSPEKTGEKAPSGSNSSSQPTGRPGGRLPPRPTPSKSKQ